MLVLKSKAIGGEDSIRTSQILQDHDPPHSKTKFEERKKLRY
jgi:hypothetical protein